MTNTDVSYTLVWVRCAGIKVTPWLVVISGTRVEWEGDDRTPGEFIFKNRSLREIK